MPAESDQARAILESAIAMACDALEQCAASYGHAHALASEARDCMKRTLRAIGLPDGDSRSWIASHFADEDCRSRRSRYCGLD